MAAYLLHWLLVPAAMREAFFGRWVPLVCRGYHAVDVGYRDMGDGIFADPVAALDRVAVVGAIALGMRPRTHLREQFVALGALGVIGFVVAFYQKRAGPTSECRSRPPASWCWPCWRRGGSAAPSL